MHIEQMLCGYEYLGIRWYLSRYRYLESAKLGTLRQIKQFCHCSARLLICWNCTLRQGMDLHAAMAVQRILICIYVDL